MKRQWQRHYRAWLYITNTMAAWNFGSEALNEERWKGAKIMDNIKSALAHLQSAVMFMPDSEAQIEVEDAIRDLRKELEDMAESPSAADDICYHCRHMCGIRRQYVGGVMLKCVGYEKGETDYGSRKKF
jgi:hypothetical protein